MNEKYIFPIVLVSVLTVCFGGGGTEYNVSVNDNEQESKELKEASKVVLILSNHGDSKKTRF